MEGKNEVNPSLINLVFHLDQTFTDKRRQKLSEGFATGSEELRTVIEFMVTKSSGGKPAADATGFFKQGNLCLSIKLACKRETSHASTDNSNVFHRDEPARNRQIITMPIIKLRNII